MAAADPCQGNGDELDVAGLPVVRVFTICKALRFWKAFIMGRDSRQQAVKSDSGVTNPSIDMWWRCIMVISQRHGFAVLPLEMTNPRCTSNPGMVTEHQPESSLSPIPFERSTSTTLQQGELGLPIEGSWVSCAS